MNIRDASLKECKFKTFKIIAKFFCQKIEYFIFSVRKEKEIKLSSQLSL